MDRNSIKNQCADLKRRFGTKTLLLFRVEENLEAYLNDATIISNALHLPIKNKPMGESYPIPVVSIQTSEQETYINLLLDAGYGIHILQEQDAVRSNKFKQP